MPLTKLFKDTVKARIECDPAFAAALFEEALSAFFKGDTALGKSLLRDLLNGWRLFGSSAKGCAKSRSCWAIYIKFVGSHQEYDKVDALTVG